MLAERPGYRGDEGEGEIWENRDGACNQERHNGPLIKNATTYHGSVKKR
jgi:hypothetical protein